MSETQIISVDVEYPDGYLRYTNSRYSFCEFSVNCMNELNFDELYIELGFNSLVFAVHEGHFQSVCLYSESLIQLNCFACISTVQIISL